MHSSPSFDPNAFVFGISLDDWQLIRNNPMKPLINKSIVREIIHLDLQLNQ